MKALHLLTLPLLIVGCAEISYVGEEYRPTRHVDVYYSAEDITRDYSIMGEAVATGDWTMSFDKLQDEIRKKAMTKGADGVIILSWGYREKTVLTETTVATDSTSQTTISSSTEPSTSKEIRVALIRYR